MKNKSILFITVLFLFTVSITGCKSEKAMDTTEKGKETVQNLESTNNEDIVLNYKTVRCGEVYTSDDLDYNVIGVRTNEYSDSFQYLIVKLEVFNHSDNEITFSAFNRLTLFGESNAEYSLDLLADVDSDLVGMITPGNKIMGEAAFDITDSKDDNYILHIGNDFEYSPAIEISKNDIDKTFAEQFEGSGVKSEYTVGIPVESEQLTILLNSATIKPSDKAGKEILLLNLDITNNERESNSFMLGLNFGGVYTNDGVQLDEAVNDYTLQTNVDGNETINGIASFYIDEGQRDFYMTVTPNLDNYTDKVNITFTAQ